MSHRVTAIEKKIEVQEYLLKDILDRQTKKMQAANEKAAAPKAKGKAKKVTPRS
jgi:hypothetical protein